MAQSSRRALLQGSVVTALGAGIAAAPAVAAVSGSNPDAELIRMCAEHDALEHRVRALDYTALPDSEEEAGFEAASDALSAQQGPILERICELRGTTLEGLRARARTWALWMGEQTRDVPGDYPERRMIRALIRDLLGEDAAVLPAAPAPDAALLAACDEYVALDREWYRLCKSRGEMLTSDPEWNVIGDKMDPISSRQRALRDEVAEVVPLTFAGLRAKAEIARRHLVDDGDTLMEPESYLACTVLENLLGISGEDRPGAEA